MKKILLSLLTMLVMGVSGAWADVRVMPAYVGQLGLSDNSTPGWTYQSKYISIAAGETVEYTFTNYMKSSTTDYWCGWICEGTDGTNYFDVRMDAGYWVAPSENPVYSISYSGDAYTKYTSISDYMTDMTGAKVTLKVTRDASDSKITVAQTVTTATSQTYSGTFTVTGIVASSSIKLRLIAEGAHQDISKLVKTDAAGTASTYENYTSYITNPDFETDAAETITPTGWTVTGDDDPTATTDADKKGLIEASDWISGTKLYYSGWAGKTLSQTLSNLPAGAYTLYAQAGSWGEGNQCYLTVNGKNSANFTVEGSIVDLSQNFGIAEASDVTIGSGASWGRRIDNFTLVRTGDYVADSNWKVDFTAMTGTDKDAVTVSAEVSDGMGTGTLVDGTALDEHLGLATNGTWIWRAAANTKTYAALMNSASGARNIGAFNAKAGQLVVLNSSAEPASVTNATLKMTNGTTRVYSVDAEGTATFSIPRSAFVYSIQVSDELYTWYAKASTGDDIASGACTKGDAVTVAYPACLVKDGVLYNADKASNDYWYQTTFTPDAMDYTQTINYTESEVKDVIYYTEAEAVSGVTTTGKYANRASNAVIAYTNTDGTDNYKEVTTIPAGTYTIFARGINGNSSERACNFKVGDNVVFAFTIINGTNVTGTSESFTIDADATLSVSCTGSSTSGLDYFYVAKYDPSAINSVNASKASDNKVIKTVNGIIKNGKKYNYAGQQMK